MWREPIKDKHDLLLVISRRFVTVIVSVVDLDWETGGSDQVNESVVVIPRPAELVGLLYVVSGPQFVIGST